ncbi:WD40 repeat-like protein [Athelia psychrophila]|uniref:WD40 repeat-like protein n=1 Tax=Athelia psychrophila TaxID=1759441 RepID=A0A166LMH5_9AGAM|nr:WD40 repeat-like protein [Fibularhizoctonia sp. CBS 109695]
MDATSRPRCLEGTRTALLQNLITDLTAPTPQTNVLWLHGVAGSGKSTISTTVAERLHDRGQLGAFLFFNRNTPAQSGPDGVIRTIAYQLAFSNTILRDAICDAIKRDAQIATRSLDAQFEALLLNPLRLYSNKMTGPMVIILDAFDECGDAESRRALVYLLITNLPLLPHEFCLFITGRPELNLQNAFGSHRKIKSVSLSAPKWSSTSDVLHYIQHELNVVYQARRASDELALDWPGMPRIKQFGSRAGDSFIWAATGMRYLRTADDLDERLDLLLSQQVFSLSDLYATALRSASNWAPNEISTEICRRILGAVVVGRIPLIDEVVDGILGLERSRSCRRILRKLGCLLQWSEGLPIRSLHASFTDYLADGDACGDQPWFIDKPKHHADFTIGCLHVMKRLLHFNMCGLKTSCLMNRDVEDIAERVESSIPPSLAYACRFWSEHLRNANRLDHNVRPLILEFFEVFFLYWLEVLSLIGEGRAASEAMGAVERYSKDHEDTVHRFAKDGIRFVGAFASVIAVSAPHVYISTLPFAPSTSVINQHYSSIIKGRLRVTNGARTDWPSCEQSIEGHTANVYLVAFSPDGERILSGAWDNSIRIWDALTGKLVAGPFQGHTRNIYSVAFSPDSERVASGSCDNTISIWDVRTGEHIAGPLNGHTSDVCSLAFSLDCKRVASSSLDLSIRIWDARTGTLVAGPFKGHTGPVYSVVFSPEGERVASGSRDKTIRIWDAHTGRLVALAGPFEGHTRSVFSVAFSPDGERVASGSYDKTVRIWDARTGELIVGPLEGHTGWVCSVAFSPDSERVASGSWDNTVRIWDARTGKAIAGPFKGHTSNVSSVVFSPDGERFASGSWDNTIRTWNAHTGNTGPFEDYTGKVSSVALSPDGERVASGSSDKTIRMWGARTGKLVAGPFEGHTGSVCSIAFPPNGDRIASGSYDKTVRIWDARTGELIAGPLEGHTGWVCSVAFSPDSGRVASGSWDNTVRIWDARTGKAIAGPFKGHTSNVSSVVFSPEGERVASGSQDKIIRIWDARTGKLVAGPFEHLDSVRSVACSPDGECVSSSSWENTVRIWHARTGKPGAGPFEGHTSIVSSVALLLDGERVTSGSSDKNIHIWNFIANSDSLLAAALKGHTQSVASASNSHLVNGWMQSSPTKLLFWVPPDHRTRLWQANDTFVIGHPCTYLDLTNFVYGDNWAQCHV